MDSKILHFNQKLLNIIVYFRVEPHAVAFKVLPNSRGLNVTEVARRIGKHF